jgi:multicomponent Na+:H+ antiporter subunit D
MITALPLLTPLFVVVLLLLAGRNARRLKYIGLSGILLLFLVNLMVFQQVSTQGILVTQAGGWKAPFGITLVIDLFSAVMLGVTSFIALLVGFYSLKGIDDDRHRNYFFLFFHTLLMGVNGAFIAGDIFNMYVWFEVMVISSFVLITLGSEKQQLEGAIKYVTMNLLGSFLFLAGIGLVYGKTGTLNLADLSVTVGQSDQSFLMNSSFILFFMAFGIKAAIFPFFFWLPSSYHTPPIAVTALFAGLLTKVGVYAMIRFFTLYISQMTPFWQTLLLSIAGLTMVIGVLAAASQYDIRRILSFHIISQIGYMIMGLGIFSGFALAAAIYFMIHNILAKTAAFLAGGLVFEKTGSYQLKSIGGLFKTHPWLGLLFFLPAMALAGLPPLSGFFGKLFLIKGGFESGHFVVTGVAIWVSIVTLFSMMKIWNEAYWKPHPKGEEEISSTRLKPSMVYPVAIMALSTLAFGLLADWFIELLLEASEMLKNPQTYIEAVLGKN